MPEMIDVHLACNDERGNPTDRVFMVEFHEPGGDMLALLEAPDLEEGVALVLPDPVRTRGQGWMPRRHHVGNWCWDSQCMDRDQALYLAAWLIEQGFSVTECITDEEPWSSLEVCKFDFEAVTDGPQRP